MKPLEPDERIDLDTGVNVRRATDDYIALDSDHYLIRSGRSRVALSREDIETIAKLAGVDQL